MKKTKKTKGQASQVFPGHVLLFAIYPILALLAHNISQVAPASALLPLGLSVVGAGMLLLLVRLWLREWQRAALVTTILLVLFFSYGHIYSYLKGVTVSGIYLFRHRSLAPLWIVLAGLGVWWASRKRLDTQKYTEVLNIIGITLLVFPAVQVGSGLWKQWRAWSELTRTAPVTILGDTVSGDQDRPDIYYIILDAYGRADVLRELYRYDNSEFISSLELLGFYVADCSQSNYSQTVLSLPSSLNYDYLDDLYNLAKDQETPLRPLISQSVARRFLELRGYKTVAFETGFNWSQITDADVYLAPQPGRQELNAFQYMLVQTTAGRLLLDVAALGIPNVPDYLSRRRTEFVLEKLQGLPSMNGPKFVFVHLVIPHPPYVFGPNGEATSIDMDALTPEISAKGYIDQTIFISEQMKRIVAEIIANSPTPPIIILQGDHGPNSPNMAYRMANLNAYYLPGHEDMLYSTITPVNTFRIIFDEYFGQNLPLLPDISLYSTAQASFNFTEVENNCSK